MKRAKNLFERIPQRSNLDLAVRKALKGKRSTGDAKAYVARLDENLNDLARQLREGCVVVGRSKEFTIHDPKERTITAPCFAERVLHHAIMNVCEPEFEKRLIHHSYACRRGKGQFAAIATAKRFAASNDWFLKGDARKYFESIPKTALIYRLERVFADRPLVDLFAAIIHAHHPDNDRGLPIGSLISQHCANLYLDQVDRIVTGELGYGGYVRYMDDFVVWSRSRADLRRIRDPIRLELSKIGLAFKTEPLLNRTILGMDFLGHRIFRNHVALNRRSRKRFISKMDRLEADLESGRISERDAQRKGCALVAFTTRYGREFLRKRVMFAHGCGP